MKLYIPNIGDCLVLTKEWLFELHDEPRNESLYKFFGGTPGSWIVTRKLPIKVILPKNTVLRVDRVYIRVGNNKTYNSVTFLIRKAPFSFSGKLRFWVKLEETRRIEFEIYEDK